MFVLVRPWYFVPINYWMLDIVLWQDARLGGKVMATVSLELKSPPHFTTIDDSVSDIQSVWISDGVGSPVSTKQNYLGLYVRSDCHWRGITSMSLAKGLKWSFILTSLCPMYIYFILWKSRIIRQIFLFCFIPLLYCCFTALHLKYTVLVYYKISIKLLNLTQMFWVTEQTSISILQKFWPILPDIYWVRLVGFPVCSCSGRCDNCSSTFTLLAIKQLNLVT